MTQNSLDTAHIRRAQSSHLRYSHDLVWESPDDSETQAAQPAKPKRSLNRPYSAESGPAGEAKPAKG